MSKTQNNELEDSDPATPIYVGGVFSVLFTVDALLFLYYDRTNPSIENKAFLATFTLASLLLIGLTASNLREAGKGSILAGFKNTFFGASSENKPTYSPLPAVESSAVMKCS